MIWSSTACRSASPGASRVTIRTSIGDLPPIPAPNPGILANRLTASHPPCHSRASGNPERATTALEMQHLDQILVDLVRKFLFTQPAQNQLLDHEAKRVAIGHIQIPAIVLKEDQRAGECGALVALRERVVSGNARDQCRRETCETL